jgi:hypothetical protein
VNYTNHSNHVCLVSCVSTMECKYIVSVFYVSCTYIMYIIFVHVFSTLTTLSLYKTILFYFIVYQNYCRCHYNSSMFYVDKLMAYYYLNVFLIVLYKLYLRIECILLKFHRGMKALTEVHFQSLHVENVVRSRLSWFKYNYKNWMHSFEVSLGYESLDRTTFSTWSDWKCTSVNAFIPQWNFKRIHSILK